MRLLLRRLSVLFQILFVSQRVIRCLSILDLQDGGGQLGDKIAVMRNEQHRSFVFAQRFLQRLFAQQIQMVGRFIEHQKVRLGQHELHQAEADLFSPGQAVHGLEHLILGEQKAA